MIKLFLDTNMIFPDFDRVFTKLDFYGGYKRILKKEKIINKYEKIINIFIPKIVIMEFKQKCIEGFLKYKKEIEEANHKLEKVFGNNLIHKSKLKWESVDDYRDFLDQEIEALIANSKEDFTVLEVPDCFQEVIIKAIQKSPQFKEAKSLNKTYYDAGFKDNLIYQTIKANIGPNDHGIFFTKDNDFELENKNENIYIIREFQSFEDKLLEIFPKYFIYSILNELDDDLKKRQLIDILDYPFDSKLHILGFDENYCEIDEDEDSTTIKVLAEINNKKKEIFVKYDVNSNTLLGAYE